jgi:hypothetical protein
MALIIVSAGAANAGCASAQPASTMPARTARAWPNVETGEEAWCIGELFM